MSVNNLIQQPSVFGHHAGELPINVSGHHAGELNPINSAIDTIEGLTSISSEETKPLTKDSNITPNELQKGVNDTKTREREVVLDTMKTKAETMVGKPRMTQVKSRRDIEKLTEKFVKNIDGKDRFSFTELAKYDIQKEATVKNKLLHHVYKH